jgi:predicted porin
MNKKLMAVAVAAAVAAPGLALAQATVYGSFNVEYGFLSQADSAFTGTGRPNVDAFNSGASYVGVKGEEKMGGGMSAWFQCETRARLGVDTSDSQATSGICDRNTALGLKGGFGNLFFGRWDSPLNLAQDAGRGGLLQTTGWTGIERLLLGDGGAGGFKFDFARRNPNSVNYNTPNFGGFTGSLQYTSTNDALSTADAAAAAATPSAFATAATTSAGKKGRAISASGYYSSGPLEAAVAYSKHDDNQGDTATFEGASAKAWLLGASYVFGPVKVGVLYTDLSGDVSTTTDVEQKNWSLGVAWKITGPGTVRFGYTQAGDFKGTAASTAGDQGAKQYVVGYSHAMSKRTTASVFYSAVDNDTAGIWNFAGTTAAGAVKPGSDANVVSLQLQHKF